MALKGKSPAGARAAEVIRRLDGLRKDKTVTISCRVDPRDRERLIVLAAAEHLETAALIKKLVLDGLARLDRKG